MQKIASAKDTIASESFLSRLSRQGRNYTNLVACVFIHGLSRPHDEARRGRRTQSSKFREPSRRDIRHLLVRAANGGDRPRFSAVSAHRTELN